MSRLLVMGVGPIAPEKPRRLMAPGLRTWSFAEYLAQSGHEVVLVEALFGGGDIRVCYPVAQFSLPHGVQLWHVVFHVQHVAAACRRLHEEKRFDAAIATTDLMCAALAEARLSCPIWLDFNGHPMAERQMLAALHGNDAGLRDQWNLVVPCLLAGDRFSTCSTPQRHALLGELAVAGRLNERTAALDFVHSLPPVMPSLDLKPTGPAVRGKAVPNDAFIVLWTGGYNTWTDVDTLFEGLAMAMGREARLYFVSTGGAIEGHDDRTYRRFESLIAASPFRERFVLSGWVELDEVKNYYAEANVAVNIDADTVEGRLGHRNRVTEWIMAGTPVISTALSEITRNLAGEDAMTAFAIGDAAALRDALLAHAADPALGARQNARARDYLARRHAPGVVYRPLAAWAANPAPAPDLPPPEQRGPGRPWGPAGQLAARLEEMWRRPPGAGKKPFGFGLGIKPRIERWIRKMVDAVIRSGRTSRERRL